MDVSVNANPYFTSALFVIRKKELLVNLKSRPAKFIRFYLCVCVSNRINYEKEIWAQLITMQKSDDGTTKSLPTLSVSSSFRPAVNGSKAITFRNVQISGKSSHFRIS